MRAAMLGAMIVLSALPDDLDAQVVSDDSVKRARCTASVDSFRSATTKDQRELSLKGLQTCPDDARIVAFRTVIRENRRLDKDEAMMVVYRLVFHRNSGLGRDVLELAGDRSASPQSRIVAFMALSALKRSDWAPRYEGFSSGLDARGNPKALCASRTLHTSSPPEGSDSLPAGFLDDARRVAARVYDDRTEPVEVRSAAACM